MLYNTVFNYNVSDNNIYNNNICNNNICQGYIATKKEKIKWIKEPGGNYYLLPDCVLYSCVARL